MTEHPNERKLGSMAEYHAAMDEIIGRARRTLRVFDRQLDRSFNAVQRCERLRAFLLADRRNRLRIVLHDTSNLPRECARLLEIQRQFSHAVAIHETRSEARQVQDPFALADENDHLHRFHHDHARAVLRLGDTAGTRTFIERFEEIWSFSDPSVNATTLGL